MVTPKKPTKIICQKFFQVILCGLNKTKGIKTNEAKKKRINAKVNGGILVRASLNMGDAAPQMMLAIIKARIGFIKISLKVFKVKSLKQNTL